MGSTRTRAVFDTSISCRDPGANGLPAGEEVADAIAGALRERGVAVSHRDATSTSWFLKATLDGVELGVHVVHATGWVPSGWPPWLVFLDDPGPGVLARLVARRSPAERKAAVARLQRTMHEILDDASRFSATRWLTDDEWPPL